MINRQNWELVNRYLNYLSTVLLQSEDTVSRRREQLRHFLEWANAKPINQIKTIEPSFPIYISTARNDGKIKPLSASTIKKTCETVQRFLTWGKIHDPRRLSSILPYWIDTIRPARSTGIQSVIKTHEFYSLEELNVIANLKLDKLRDVRDQAAICFMFLSGIRVGAFVTLPIKCIDLSHLSVDQFPSEGVLTKNHKAAQTSLYQIPEILQRVIEWDSLVRSSLPEHAAWYSSIDQTGEILTEVIPKNTNRSKKVNTGIQRLCEMANLNYRSSHKFRHGHVVYGLKLVKDMAGLKAISQNVMHSSIGITDGVYGSFCFDDVHKIITSIKPENIKEEVDKDLLRKLADLADILKENPKILDSLAKD